MKTIRYGENPLDDALRDRLHLKSNSGTSLFLIRSVIQFVDATSRMVSGKPFFALRESENLLRQLEGLTGPAFVRALLDFNDSTRLVAHGLDHVPDSGPVLIAATHPTGLFDFFAHASALMDKRSDLKVVANEETEKFLGPDLIVPVQISKENRAVSGQRTRRGMEQHLQNGGALLVFGSGRVADRKDGFLVEPSWRSGATVVSESCGVSVVPASLDTRNSSIYYRTRALARKLSRGDENFGAMIGSLRYTAELLEQLGRKCDVYYGDPMAPGTSPELLQARAEGLVNGLYASTQKAQKKAD